MTNAMAFGIAVGGTSLICYLLMTRLQNSKRNRCASGEGFSTDAGHDGGGHGAGISNWSGGGHSTTDSSGNPADFGGGGGDSGGGGDGGGGDGGSGD